MVTHKLPLTIMSCLLILALSLSLIEPSYAAVVNGGFETGDFTGWTTETCNDFTGIMGTAYPKSSAPTAHAFIVTPGTDPNVPVNTVHDGSYAARIGYTYDEFESELGGCESPSEIHWQTTITQTATVPAAPATSLNFWYAVGAMGNHAQGVASGFILTVKLGATTIYTASNEAYTSPSNAPGWTWIGGLAYYDWTLVSVNLASYGANPGDSLTITLLVHGCQACGHTAWAYLDNISIDIPHVVVTTTVTDTVTSVSTTTVTGTKATTSTIGISTSKFTSYSTTTSGGTATEYVIDLTRVYVNLLVIQEFVTRAVGGLLMSTNKLEILAPYLALAGLFAAISTVELIVRRRKG